MMVASWWLLPYALMLALVLWMAARILAKAGFSPWWAVVLVVPVLAVAGLWVFAFIPWPRLDRVRTTPPSDYEGGWNVPERPDEPDPHNRGHRKR